MTTTALMAKTNLCQDFDAFLFNFGSRFRFCFWQLPSRKFCSKELGEDIAYAEINDHSEEIETQKVQFGHSDARSVLKIEAFKQNGTHFIYSFLSFRVDAQLVTVDIFKPVVPVVDAGTLA